MRGLIHTVALLALGLLAACEAPKVTPDKISGITPGKTTYDQVVDSFGLPSSEVYLAGGSRVVLYNQDQFDRSASEMVPFANLFFNNYDRTVYDYFIFNREGVLQSFSVPQFSRMAGVANPGT